MNKTQLTRISLLLSLTLIFQSLRFIIPLPPIASTFLVGALVNTCLIVSAISVNVRASIFIAVIAPFVAYFQGLIPIPLLIIPILFGNIIYILIYHFTDRRMSLFFSALLSSLAKTLFIYFTVSYLLQIIALPAKVAQGLMFVMSWPQLITGFFGILLAHLICKRLKLQK